jgi:hypothetical protein
MVGLDRPCRVKGSQMAKGYLKVASIFKFYFKFSQRYCKTCSDLHVICGFRWQYWSRHFNSNYTFFLHFQNFHEKNRHTFTHMLHYLKGLPQVPFCFSYKEYKFIFADCKKRKATACKNGENP